jgi:hypothetical protein
MSVVTDIADTVIERRCCVGCGDERKLEFEVN